MIQRISSERLGEHGDSMAPVWSSATVAGLPLGKHPGWTPHAANEPFQRTKTSGAEVIKKKGGAGFAVGSAIRDVIECVALDQQRILPVSTVQQGCCRPHEQAFSSA
jgi:L-lactate dehydrogenase